MIERLKETNSKTRIAYSKLDRVVGEGYKYYLNAGAEKRNLQEIASSPGYSLAKDETEGFLTPLSINNAAKKMTK